MVPEFEAYEDDIATKRPVDDQIQRTLTFVQEHETMLRKIEEATRIAIAEAPETHYRAIRIAMEPPERVFANDLINTDNELLRKVLTVLVFLCDEIRELKDIAETKIFRSLIMFGQTPITSTQTNETLLPGDRESMIGKFLPTLQDLSNFVDRCYSVAANLVQQLAALLSPKEHLYRTTFQTAHLTSVFSSLGELLAVLVTLDCIVDQSESLKEHWGYYKTMITYARQDPASFGTDEAGIGKFERLLVSIDQSIMIGEMFKGCIEQNFEYLEEEEGQETCINVRGNEAFFKEMLHSLKALIDSSLAVIGSSSELFERHDVVKALALYALYRRLLPPNMQPDSKLHKALWGVQKQVPLVVVCENVMWTAGEFLLQHAPLEIKKPDPPNAGLYRREYVKSFDAALASRTASLVSQIGAWLVLAESRIQPCLRHEASIPQSLDIRGSILLKGLSLANRAQNLAKSCLVMHYSMQIPMSRSALADIALLVESLKAVEFTFMRKDSAIAEGTVHTMRILFHAVLNSVYPLRMRLEGNKRLDGAKLDLLSSLVCIEHTVRSSDTLSPSRQAALSVLTEIVVGSPLLNEKEGTKLRSYVRRLIALANFPSDIRRACDSSFLYLHKDLLPRITASIYQLPTEANRLQYIMGAFNDGIRLCQAVAHKDASPFFLAYRAFLRDTLRAEIIMPLCRDIENDLRMHIHTKNLQHMQTLNPKTENARPFRPLLDLPPLRILGLMVNIKNEVTHYLDRTFYNLTTVALHDWRTYSDMKSLALEKLGLHLMDNFLPMGSLEQGLDVLQIMRNIHIFVSRFTYNMNMQQFIEFRPDKASKHFNTIKIQSIAASIRQHGLGVLNTTVNFTYQFLAQKFNVFSQFLFDDYIRAHLSREHRWFKKHKNEPEVNNMYPYDRALKFVRDIRKLGVNDAGKSFLDQFRILVTEIGNALGYVRMVRSASMYYCSEAVKFIPDFEHVIPFEKHAGAGDGAGRDADVAAVKPIVGAGLSEETVRAGRNLDGVISTLVKNFGEGSDYFKVLVNVFQSVLLTAEHDHLKSFYMIVPALCISWVDASLQAKDNMFKATRGGVASREMYYADDGFAVGVAYCLAILKQTKRNDALHWVDTIRHKHKVDGKALAKQQALRAEKEARIKERKDKEERKKSSISAFFTGKSKGKEEPEEEDFEDMEEVHTLQITGKRLEAQRRESEQLFYSMSGAGIFFKRTDVDT